VFNVCTGTATSVEALAALIAELAGKNLNARPAPPRAGEIRHSLGAPDRADRVLGLPDRVPLRTGLARVLGWLNETAR
jgi:UDP-glucose 4-epimerase